MNGRRYELVDAEVMERESPETFTLPCGPDRRGLRPGDFAKLCFDHKERMWVRVTNVKVLGEKTWYSGVLDNSPVATNIELGDSVNFQPRHIYDIRYANSDDAGETDTELH